MILVIDYGMSNLGSIRRALEECGGDVLVSDDPSDLKNAERIILPGVGSYVDGMSNLKQRGWISELNREVLENKIPLLGICLGMQLLSTKGYEHGETDGLNYISGEVIKLAPTDLNERIPHVGWNEVYKKRDNSLFENLNDGSDFYFVHSYHFRPDKTDCILAITPYCGEFVSAVNKENIYRVQFHPEKSIPVGFQLLKNFIYRV